MNSRYEEQAILKWQGVKYFFEPGDLIMAKKLKLGKLVPKATGPYMFVKYKGVSKTTALVRTQEGRVLEFAAGHLIPVMVGVEGTVGRAWTAE